MAKKEKKLMRSVAIAFAALATACVSAPDTTPINHMLTAPPAPPVEIELGVGYPGRRRDPTEARYGTLIQTGRARHAGPQ